MYIPRERERERNNKKKYGEAIGGSRPLAVYRRDFILNIDMNTNRLYKSAIIFLNKIKQYNSIDKLIIWRYIVKVLPKETNSELETIRKYQIIS